MQTIKNFFISASEETLQAKLALLKQNLQLTLKKNYNYNESVGKIKSYKKFLIFIFNLFASEYPHEDIIQLKETPIELAEFFVPQIIGFYITHAEFYPELGKTFYEIILHYSKHSIKFSHLVVWNILSCKNVYRRFCSLQRLKDILVDIMEHGCQNQFDNTFTDYETFFIQYNSLETFIDKCLVPDHEIVDILSLTNSNPEFNESKNNESEEDHKLIENNENTNPNIKPPDFLNQEESKIENFNDDFDFNGSPEIQFKWKKYLSTLNFINDLITVSEILKNLNDEYRNGVLLNYIRKLNSQKLPGAVYIPIDLIGKNCLIKQSVLRICEEYAFCLSSKDKVPFHILIEVIEIKENKAPISFIQNNTLNLPNIMNIYNSDKESSNIYINNDEKLMEDKQNKGIMYNLFGCCYAPDEKVNEPKINTLYGTNKFYEIESNLLKSSCFSQYPNRRIISLIVKGLEDMRQDMFVSQVIQLFTSFFQKDNINIYMEPIHIISNGRGGIIQTLVNATSLDKIKKLNPFLDDLKHYFSIKFGGYNSKAYKNAIMNFIESLVGFSLLCYILQVKDRHNGNILIDDEGRLIHIDYGFLLNFSPGNMNFEKAPFKLTGEYVDLMEGINSKYFKEFKTLFLNAFLILRKNHQKILSFIEIYIFTNSDLPCFKDKDNVINGIKERFLIHETLDEVKHSVNRIIEESRDHWRTKFYDGFQKYCVGIK